MWIIWCVVLINKSGKWWRVSRMWTKGFVFLTAAATFCPNWKWLLYADDPVVDQKANKERGNDPPSSPFYKTRSCLLLWLICRRSFRERSWAFRFVDHQRETLLSCMTWGLGNWEFLGCKNPILGWLSSACNKLYMDKLDALPLLSF